MRKGQRLEQPRARRCGAGAGTLAAELMDLERVRKHHDEERQPAEASEGWRAPMDVGVGRGVAVRADDDTKLALACR